MKTRQLCLYFTHPQSVRLHFPLIVGWHKHVATYDGFSSSDTCVLFTGTGTRHGASTSKGTRNKTFEKIWRQNNTVLYGKWPQRESHLRFASSLAVGQCRATMARADARNIVTAAGRSNSMPECQYLNPSLVPFPPILPSDHTARQRIPTPILCFRPAGRPAATIQTKHLPNVRE